WRNNTTRMTACRTTASAVTTTKNGIQLSIRLHLDAIIALWLSLFDRHRDPHPPRRKEILFVATQLLYRVPQGLRRAHAIRVLCPGHTRGLHRLFATEIREFPRQISVQIEFLPELQYRVPRGRN